MSASRSFLLLSILVFVLGACSSDSTVTKTQIKKDVWGNKETFSVGKDADGNPMMKSDKRSSYENTSSNIAANRDFSGKDYTKSSYRKDRWGGKSNYDRTSYQGNTSAKKYKREPWFVKQQAALSNRKSSLGKQGYTTAGYRSAGRASEQGGRRIASRQDAQISNRRSSYKQPEVTGWKDQQGLSVKETNGMLGR